MRFHRFVTPTVIASVADVRRAMWALTFEGATTDGAGIGVI
jgi:hypothetical protein